MVTLRRNCDKPGTTDQITNMKLALSEYRNPTGVRSAFTLVEIMIVVSIIGLLLAIAIPSFLKSREASQLNSIFNNLRMVESAKNQWALENQKGAGDTPDWNALSDYIKGGTVKAAASEIYTINSVGTNAYATCSVRLGTYAASDPIPPQ
jgi:prepilin-type N-terminal cleavage/methylation domain-containing protein